MTKALLTKLALLVAVCLAAAMALPCTGARLPPPPLPAALDGAPAAVDEVVEQQFKPLGAINIEYDVTGGGYPGFQTQLHQVLKTNQIVETIPVMVRQTAPKSPPTWILITLTAGRSSRDKTTMAVRNDNIYVVGFTNSTGTWFAFPSYRRLVQGAIALPVEEDYRSLVGGHENLPNYDISKETVLQDVRFLSTYRSALAGDKNFDEKLGISLARLIVLVAESARFKPVYTTVAQGLQQQPTRISEKEADLLVLWSDLSKSLIKLKKTGKWVHKRKYTDAGVTSAQDAIDTLRLMIWPKGEELPKLPPTGGNPTF